MISNNDTVGFTEYWFEPTNKDLADIKKFFTKAHSLIGRDRVCYIYGEGKQPLKTWKQIENSGFNVVWKGIHGPRWIKLLSFVIASYYGLVKIHRLDEIQPLINQLSHLAAVGCYSFHRSFENEFLDIIINDSVHPFEFLRKDKTVFEFALDGDSLVTESNLLSILGVGKDCPEELKTMVINFGEIGYVGSKFIKKMEY